MTRGDEDGEDKPAPRFLLAPTGLTARAALRLRRNKAFGGDF